jgi:hypothetical protein
MMGYGMRPVSVRVISIGCDAAVTEASVSAFARAFQSYSISVRR